MNTLVQPAINLIKANNIIDAYPMIMTVVKNLIDSGAKSVVLGCTELPLSVREDSLNGIPIVNSIDSLIREVHRWYKD